ncbi:AAA family ATPase [candidate division KSB1 bacterium]
MSKPIHKIELSGFRGATVPFTLEFDHSKDVTMLFGENGSGKSSILDSIDVVANSCIGSLEDISVGRNPGKYLCSLGTPPTNLGITLHSDPEIWTGTMHSNNISITGPDIKPIVTILRRNKILTLVLAQPKDRYDALKRFIDIGKVEQSEKSLELELKKVNESINELVRSRQRQNEQLENVWETENKPGPGTTALEWASDKVETGIENLETQLEHLTQVVNTIDSVTTANSTYDLKKSDADNKQVELTGIQQEIADSPGINPITAVQLINSLSKAKEYIDVELALDKCPTCQRPIDRVELLSIVNEQFTELKELKDLNDRKNIVERSLTTAKQNLSIAESEFNTALQSLQDAMKDSDISELTSLSVEWPDLTDEHIAIDSLKTVADSYNTIHNSLLEKQSNVQRDVNQYSSIKEWFDGINEADTQLASLDRIKQGLQSAYDIVHAKRMAFSKTILDDIAEEANRLYQVIHPGEKIALDSLSMDEARRGSLHQTGKFHDHDNIPPQAVFSESHLDTLGFCVWLALAKKENPENTVLLIDDVFTSVDAPHLGRIIDLLSTEGQNFLQIIVATHYRLWWDRCQSAQGIQRVHLGEWSVENGISAQNMPLITEQLQELTDAPVLDRQALSSKAGILLECTLDGLALQYGQSLPRNKQNLYTLGALVNASSKLFTRHSLTVKRNVNWNVADQPEDWQETPGSAAFERIKALQFIRNQVGCHFNPPGTEIPDNGVREFGGATVDLVEALTCPNCGYLATKPTREGTALRCSCSKQAIRMTPVTAE